jgi:hypothetical protein
MSALAILVILCICYYQYRISIQKQEVDQLKCLPEFQKMNAAAESIKLSMEEAENDFLITNPDVERKKSLLYQAPKKKKKLRKDHTGYFAPADTLLQQEKNDNNDMSVASSNESVYVPRKDSSYVIIPRHYEPTF